jgi:hypothetical protein
METPEANQHLIVYRLCKGFPPGFPEEYVAAGIRRSFAAQPEAVQRAARGLSVYTTLNAVLANARRFPRLGTTVVRYTIPMDSPLRILHLVGPGDHLTVLGDFSELHACLDSNWHLDTVTIER